MHRAAVAALFLLLACAAAEAQVYRWVDKDGKVHYSDQKPPSAKADALAIESKPADPEADVKALAELREQNAGLDQAAAARAESAAERARAAERKRQLCATARADANLLESVNRTYTVDANGERVYDDDARLATRRAEARARVAEHCD